MLAVAEPAADGGDAEGSPQAAQCATNYLCYRIYKNEWITEHGRIFGLIMALHESIHAWKPCEIYCCTFLVFQNWGIAMKTTGIPWVGNFAILCGSVRGSNFISSL